jgi:hypothetical protein
MVLSQTKWEEQEMKIKIHVFGKPDCPKCNMLNERIDGLLKRDEYSQFEKVYHDCMTEDGLVAFCLAQQLNPSKIPAFVLGNDDGYIEKIESDEVVLPPYKIFSKYGLQTDWRSDGLKGNIPLQLIKDELNFFKENFK